MKTRGVIHEDLGKPLIIGELDLGDPGPTHVLVKQFATGVCHSQIHQILRPGMYHPMVLGHESTGVVVGTGSAVTHVKEGDRVMVTWVRRDVAPGRPDPVHWNVKFGGTNVRHGDRNPTGVFTWADTTIVDEQYVVKLPDDPGLPMDLISIVGCAVMTGCGAVVNSAKVRPGESVAIIGAGGVGLCAIQAAYNLGAYPLIAVDLTDEKLDFARQFGASHTVNASQVDAVEAIRELTGGGADYAFDAIGIGKTTEQILQAVRPGINGYRDGGTAVLVGVPHGAEPQLNMWEIFGGKVFRGAPGGSCRPDRDLPMFVRWFTEGRLPLEKLITKRYTLDQINEACADLEHGKISGRAIVELGG